MVLMLYGFADDLAATARAYVRHIGAPSAAAALTSTMSNSRLAATYAQRHTFLRHPT